MGVVKFYRTTPGLLDYGCQWAISHLLRSNPTLWLCLRLASSKRFWRVTYINFYPVRSFHRPERVIRAARKSTLISAKLHTLTSHTSQRVTSPHTFFQKNITRVCLDCIVLSCIVLCVRVKGFVFFSYHFIPTIVLFS